MAAFGYGFRTQAASGREPPALEPMKKDLPCAQRQVNRCRTQQVMVQPRHRDRPDLLCPVVLRIVHETVPGARAGQKPHGPARLHQGIGQDQRLVIGNRLILGIVHQEHGRGIIIHVERR